MDAFSQHAGVRGETVLPNDHDMSTAETENKPEIEDEEKALDIAKRDSERPRKQARLPLL